MIAPAIATFFLAALLWGAVILFRPALWWVAAALTLLAALAWAIVLLWKRHKKRAASGSIERGVNLQGKAQAESARPEQRGELEAIHGELAKAIQALKGSSQGGGRDALAVLPWYMIIGPSNPGKSTALRASGLRFPYLSKRGGVRGVGGTRNCDWWLTNEAVLLDTAGRYSTQEEDHDEWMS